MSKPGVTMQRRQIFKTMGGLMAVAALPPMRQETAPRTTDITARLARYMAASRNSELPPEVTLAAKHRILDTLGAIVSGAKLKPGEMAIRFVQAQGGASEATVPTTK